MQIITTREFRANLRKYFQLAETEKVYVMRRNARPIIISVATDTDDEEELTAEELSSIRRGLEDIKAGITYAMQPGESLESFLERVEPKTKKS